MYQGSKEGSIWDYFKNIVFYKALIFGFHSTVITFKHCFFANIYLILTNDIKSNRKCNYTNCKNKHEISNIVKNNENNIYNWGNMTYKPQVIQTFKVNE